MSAPRATRRTVLGAGLATALSAPMPGALAGSVAKGPVTDAHVHLFNHADLPIAGFLTHVFYATYVGQPPRWAAAVIDLFGGFLKSVTPSATDELNAVAAKGLATADFGDRVAAEIRTRTASAASAGRPMPDAAGPEELADSYRALSQALLDETGTALPDGARFRGDRLAEAVRRSAEAAQAGTADPVESGSDKGLTKGIGDVFSSAARTIGWGYLMAKSRREHLAYYLAKMVSDDRAPRRLVSLMVDYDYWLDDTPKAGSAPMEQVAVMHRIRQVAAPGVGVEIFAGVCPLRLAVETARGGSRLFDALKAAHGEGRIQGFKMYPPMGFLPWGNTKLGDADFDPPPAWRRTAAKRWKELGLVSASLPLGTALDRALDEIYGFAAAARVPIVAHAGPGNQAGPGYGERANPVYWEQVVGRHAVRLSLGHLVNESVPFVRAVSAGAPYPPEVWALHGSLRMLDRRPAGAPDVYGDLAYMPELIDDPDLAKAFFVALARVFRPGDPDLTRILYGTDWIMFGRERHDVRFLGAVERGMRAAGYTATQIENVLAANADRFLTPAPAPAPKPE